MAISSSNLFEDNQDIHFHMDKIIDWDQIVPLREEDFKDFKEYQESGNENLAFAPDNVENAVAIYKDTLQGFADICTKEVMPNAVKIEEEGFKYEAGKVITPAAFDKNVELFTEAGYMGMFLPRQYGGWQFPNTANVIGAEIVSAADAGMATLLGTQDLGDIIYKFASDELKEKYIPKIASGEMGAAMLLSEPDYGSDLQNAQTKGDKIDDQNFKVTGTKQWITHGITHSPGGQVYLTVTRTVKKADGAFKQGGAGLSLLLVHSDDAEVTSLEHKLGIHSSPTVQLAFDNAPAELVGVEGKGLIEYTMTLMNAARLAVAAQSVGISERAYREAKEYADVRVQFGVPIRELPAVKKMLMNMKISTEASRALVYHTGFVVDMLEGYEAKYHKQGMTAKDIRKQPEVVKWGKVAKVLTPFSKFYAGEECNRNAYDGIQIHGGVGFTNEYDISRVYRDARITTIYEGTSQLQVVAAIGGVLEGYGKDGATMLAYQKEIRDSIQNLPSELNEYQEKLIKTENMIKEYVPEFKAQEKDFKDGYASEIVWAAAMVFISHLFLQMAAKDESGEKTKTTKVYINDTIGFTTGAIARLKEQQGLPLL